MKIRTVGFDLEDQNKSSGDERDQHEDQVQELKVLENFLKPSPLFKKFQKFPQTNLELLQKKLVASATQCGINNENITKRFLSYLESIKEVAFDKFIKNQYNCALYLLGKCLGFQEPADENYRYKFYEIKIDIVNKLMYILYTYKKNEKKNEKSNLEIGYLFIQEFLQMLQNSKQFEQLKYDQKNLLETNYFFAGRFSSKSNNPNLAIQYFKKAIEIIKIKQLCISKLTITSQQRLNTLKIKSLYKISKVYRNLDNDAEMKQYQNMALQIAKPNKDLHSKISKKIREYREKKKFTSILGKFQSRKKIELQVLKLIQESKKCEKSFYYFYQNEQI